MLFDFPRACQQAVSDHEAAVAKVKFLAPDFDDPTGTSLTESCQEQQLRARVTQLEMLLCKVLLKSKNKLDRCKTYMAEFAAEGKTAAEKDVCPALMAKVKALKK